MQVRESDPAHIIVDLSHNELILINNALNEVCHGLEIPDFTTRLGAEWKELEALRGQVQRALEAMAKRPDEG
jgi:hypothetical protein